MSKIEIGTRVKVAHKPEHDHEYGRGGVPARRANDGREGKVIGRSDARGLCFEVDTQSGCCAWYEPDELTPVDDARPGDGAHLHGIVESAQALNRGAVHWQREATEAKAAIAGWVARCDALREEAERGNAARVEAERREAAAKSIADDATIALAKEQSVRRGAVEARDKAIADREALEARIQVAQVALDHARGALGAYARYDQIDAALGPVDRALRGVPAVDRGRQGERFHAEPITRAEVAPDRPSGSLQDRLAEVERRLTIGEEMHTAHEDHFGLLDQRVAGLGNAADEVQRPKVALVAGSNGALDAWGDRGDQVGGITSSGGTFHWFARRPFAKPAGDTGLPTRDAAIAAMRAVLSTWAEIVDGAPPAAAERQEAAELSPSGRDAGAFGSNSR